MLELHGLRLAKVLIPLRHVQTIEPCFFGRTSPIEEKDVGCDRSVWGEHAARHADDCVQIEVGQQLLFDVQLCIVCAEEEPIRQDHSSTTIHLQPVHDD